MSETSIDAAMETLMGYVPDNQKIEVARIHKLEVRERQGDRLMIYQSHQQHDWVKVPEARTLSGNLYRGYLIKSLRNLVERELGETARIDLFDPYQAAVDESGNIVITFAFWLVSGVRPNSPEAKQIVVGERYKELSDHPYRYQLACWGTAWLERFTKLTCEVEQLADG